MNALARAERGEPIQIVRTREAFLHLSNAQRRLAHRYKREAQDWEAQNHYRNFAHCRLEANRLWRAAKWALQQARQSR